MTTYQELFTPIFIVISLFITISCLVGLQFLDKLFVGSKNINTIRMFGITITINVLILIFLVMSFSKVRFAEGEIGPVGNKGEIGFMGKSGSLGICGSRTQTVEEKKVFERNLKIWI